MMEAVATTGEKLKRLRLGKAWTQVQLAEKADVSPSTIVLIERGQATPQPSTRRKLSEALGVDPSELLED
ncbi:MAG: helix-turn-helix domain-containing protein [Actinomycetota bacterium]|nr:helix-turn-helix domain-containing protein [Actinomycetota bacterium]